MNVGNIYLSVALEHFSPSSFLLRFITGHYLTKVKRVIILASFRRRTESRNIIFNSTGPDYFLKRFTCAGRYSLFLFRQISYTRLHFSSQTCFSPIVDGQSKLQVCLSIMHLEAVQDRHDIDIAKNSIIPMILKILLFILTPFKVVVILIINIQTSLV
jgi:hypothetical protein